MPTTRSKVGSQSKRLVPWRPCRASSETPPLALNAQGLLAHDHTTPRQNHKQNPNSIKTTYMWRNILPSARVDHGSKRTLPLARRRSESPTGRDAHSICPILCHHATILCGLMSFFSSSPAKTYQMDVAPILRQELTKWNFSASCLHFSQGLEHGHTYTMR